MEDLILRYLNNSISAQEEELLYSWLKESDENKQHFVRIYKIFHDAKFDIEADDRGIDINLELQKTYNSLAVQQKKKNRKAKKYVYQVVAVAAAISLLLGAVWSIRYIQESRKSEIASFANLHRPIEPVKETQLILSEKKTISIENTESAIEYTQENIKVNEEEHLVAEEVSQFNQLIIPNGKRSTITFSDGTKVWANAGTRLVYPISFGKDKREIFVDGEVYLEVAKDESRPFIVKTSDVDVKVLGTKFNVSAYESDSESNIVLVEGSVKVSGNKKEETLVPNTLYRYDKELKENQILNVDATKYVAWTQGRLPFEKEELGDILKRISRYYGVNIACDIESASYLCSGKLNLRDNLEDVLKGIAHSVPITISKIENDNYQININK